MPIFYKGFGQGSRNQQGFLSFIYVHYTDMVLFKDGIKVLFKDGNKVLFKDGIKVLFKDGNKVLFKDGNDRFILVQALINISDQFI